MIETIFLSNERLVSEGPTEVDTKFSPDTFDQCCADANNAWTNSGKNFNQATKMMKEMGYNDLGAHYWLSGITY